MLIQGRLQAKITDQLGMKNPVNRLERFSFMLGAQEGELLKTNSMVYTPKELAQVFKQPPANLTTNFDAPLGKHLLENAMALDFTAAALDVVLVKVNRAATYAGIKNFEPVQNRLFAFEGVEKI